MYERKLPIDFSFPVSLQLADLSVLSLWNDPAAVLQPQPSQGWLRGFYF